MYTRRSTHNGIYTQWSVHTTQWNVHMVECTLGGVYMVEYGVHTRWEIHLQKYPRGSGQVLPAPEVG